MEFIDLICVSSSRGLAVIDMILANVREEEVDKTKFMYNSIATVIELAIKEYPFESNEEKELVNVNLENDFVFKGDETLMIFVLFNLLKNSLYYKAKIDIFLQNDEEYNYLYFQDNSVGIAQDKIDHIFDNFFTSNKEDGTGLSLPFCKMIMNAFDGDITCKSKEGEGVEFCLKFQHYPL